MKQIPIALIGSGFAAELHLEAYRMIPGIAPEIRAVCSPSARARALADRYGIPKVYHDFSELLEAEPEIEMVDLCTPPVLHLPMALQALAAGRHVICEKPLCGWFGSPSEPRMLAQVNASLDQLEQAIAQSGKQFFYAENFVYAPAVQRSRRLLQVTGDKVLFLRGEESHRGSHAPHAALWSESGGGSLIRQGCHPLTALLYLKGCPVESVIADVGQLTPALSAHERRNLLANPQDVEDLANLILTFSDGTKGSVVAGDMILGGVRNLLEVYTTGGVHHCNISQNDQMRVYHVQEETLGEESFTEKLETRQGWQTVFLDEMIARGYMGELQDFLLCAAGEKAEPECGFALARETMRIIYAAYESAHQGRRIQLN